MRWSDWARQENDRTRAESRWRQVRDLDTLGPRGRLADGTEVVSFASNDYLGMSAHPLVVRAAHEALDHWGAGAGSARLIVGGRPIHTRLEQELADWKGTERALLFPNGFAANLGVLSALGTEGTLICSDELNHASIVDGCRLARADVRTYPHADVEALDELLRAAHRAIIVSDLVFSMDGDIAPVGELLEVARRHGALLILDEAHAVLGPDIEIAGADVVRVGTLSKFVGSFGGFVAARSEIVELLINRSRPFIFTTATPPADAAAALASIELIRSAEGDALRTRLRTLIDRVRPGHDSPIIPFVVGDEAEATEVSARLLERGLLVPAIRPPSVPPGTSRLRVTLSAAHTDEEVGRLIGSLRELEVVGARA
ncbi:MAG: 8-amino-7-oxononanoate synthase [Actinomycetota bacterium]|nr:8-amino-7-oxononanoate synthase [Actinomycetota bacterium]